MPTKLTATYLAGDTNDTERGQCAALCSQQVSRQALQRIHHAAVQQQARALRHLAHQQRQLQQAQVTHRGCILLAARRRRHVLAQAASRTQQVVANVKVRRQHRDPI